MKNVLKQCTMLIDRIKKIEFYQAKQFLFETKTPLNDDSVQRFRSHPLIIQFIEDRKEIAYMYM